MNSKSFISSVACFMVVAWQGSCWADPGALFAERKAAMVKQFDVDGDGRLNMEERLAMRAHTLQAHVKDQSRGGRGFMPPILVEAYDKDGDGELDQDERTEMGMDIGRRRQKMVELYDQNEDGEINSAAERAALQKAVKEGLHDEVDAFMARFMFGQMGRSGRGRSAGGGDEEAEWKAFDQNQNGIAEAEELEAMRASQKGEQ